MQTLLALFRYNAWANARVAAACASLADADLRRPVAHAYGSVLRLLAHVLAVEDGYFELVTGAPRQPTEAETLASIVGRLREVDDAYIRVLAEGSRLSSESTFHVPWFDSALTFEQGLLQVATHSIEHRSDLARALSEYGVAPPPLDFVVFVAESHA